jgi:hypothetical protein
MLPLLPPAERLPVSLCAVPERQRSEGVKDGPVRASPQRHGVARCRPRAQSLERCKRAERRNATSAGEAVRPDAEPIWRGVIAVWRATVTGRTISNDTRPISVSRSRAGRSLMASVRWRSTNHRVQRERLHAFLAVRTQAFHSRFLRALHAATRRAGAGHDATE